MQKDSTSLNILYLSNTELNSKYWSSRQCFAYALSKLDNVKLQYATNRSYFKDLLSISEIRKQVFSSPLVSMPKNLSNLKYSGLFPSLYHYKNIENFFKKSWLKYLSSAWKRNANNGLNILFVWDPSFHNIVTELSPDLTIYFINDKFSLYTGNDFSAAEQLNQKMVERSDIVLTMHQKIKTELDHEEIHIVHNGILPEVFREDLQEEAKHFYRDINLPIIGYLGNINFKIDFDLLYSVFHLKKDWSLVLQGNITYRDVLQTQQFKKLMQLPNVHLLPPVSYDEVIEHMKCFNLGLMPYDLSTWASYCESPLKLYQYWYAGLPIVSVNLPNIRHETNLISIAKNSGQMIEQIQQELETDKPELKLMRKNIASKNTYDQRVVQIEKIIRNVATKKFGA